MRVMQASIPSRAKITTNVTSIANFIIDPEFASLMPPLSSEEHAQLEDDIEAEGRSHTPLVVWEEHNILLDGHCRYQICTRLGLPYQVRTISLADRDAARTWIIENQLARRNLTPEGRAYLIGKRYESSKMPRGGDRKSKGSKGSTYQSDTLIGDAAEQIAQVVKVGSRTVMRMADYAQAVDALSSTHGEEVRTELLTRQIRIPQEGVIDLADLGKEQQREILAAARERRITGRQIGRRIGQAKHKQEREQRKAEMEAGTIGGEGSNLYKITNFPRLWTPDSARVLPGSYPPYGPYRNLCGDNLEELHRLKAEGCLANCVMTSPPFFRKRKYGDSPQEIGQETTVEAYIELLVNVFRGVAELLHRLGSVWVNIGDKRGDNGNRLMIPERFAFRMQADGWLLADIVIWAKVFDDTDGSTEGNCMMEPARARLNDNGFEHLYRFVKTPRVSDAWSDTCAVRIPRKEQLGDDMRYLPPSLMKAHTHIEGRNAHNVWRISVGQTNESHYSVYPPELCERPIAMSCPMWVCSECGAPRTRLVERQEDQEEYEEYEEYWNPRPIGKYNSNPGDPEIAGRHDIGREYIERKPITLGWSDCGHGAWVPGTVLDPFAGTGTTAEVALKLGRSSIGIDLYPEYCELAEERCKRTVDYMKAAALNPQELER